MFLDLRNPADRRQDWTRHYARSLERVVAAESLGAKSIWLSEHHGFDDGYLPQPLTFAAAVAARTTRVRIGTAVLLAPLRHPRHIAEEAAQVDLISGGRLELGLGAGYGPAEFEAFGAELASRYRQTDFALAEVRRLLESGELTPPPIQDPLPLWAGYLGPRGARRAGRLGVGLLTLDRESYRIYRDALVEGGHEPSRARLAGALGLFLADDPERALHHVVPFLAHQQASYQRLRGDAPSATAESLREHLAAHGSLPGLQVVDAEQAVALIREAVAGLPVEHVYFWQGIGGMDDSFSDRHLELLLTRVAAALRDPGPPPDRSVAADQ